jgi:hypothetical protein
MLPRLPTRVDIRTPVCKNVTIDHGKGWFIQRARLLGRVPWLCSQGTRREQADPRDDGRV